MPVGQSIWQHIAALTNETNLHDLLASLYFHTHTHCFGSAAEKDGLAVFGMFSAGL